MNRFEIRDRCRRNLNRYTLRAFSLIPVPADPYILDVGCGSGVPTPDSQGGGPDQAGA